MLSVGSEVIKKFEAITLRSYRGEEGSLTAGQFFQGDWLLEALILPTVSMQWSDMGHQKQETLAKKSLVMLTSLPDCGTPSLGTSHQGHQGVSDGILKKAQTFKSWGL